ncbi:IPT/TIG domain-containing protein [Petrimonas sp.]|uniref:IPT/TIG domain-containing protein n=1 Tax=Petrimonas sp. TaxID=2023866 RepID=UPI002FCB9597
MKIEYKIFSSFYFVLLTINILLCSCGSSRIEEVPNNTPKKLLPKINIVTPNSGAIGDTVKIIGVNFGEVKGDLTIKFGDKTAEIIDFTDKQLTTKVPFLDSLGDTKLTVKAGDLESNTIVFVLKDHSRKISKVIDKQLWFVNEAYNTSGYRTILDDLGFHYFKGATTTMPREQPVPWSKNTETFAYGVGKNITDNVYIESGWNKPWIFQIAISTPGIHDTQDGSAQTKAWYRTSNNNGASFTPLKLLVVKGYTNMNPIEGVEIGRNGYNVDFTRPIVRASNGEIMVPVCLSPWDEINNKIYLPIQEGWFYQDAGVLIGKWLSDGSDLTWEFGGWLRLNHNKSTRGLSEPSIVELKTNGHFAMVCRGSNSGRPELPGHAWVSFSNDYCRTWSEPIPFIFSNGETFYVPACQSALFKSKINGKTYWIGNLQQENTKGNFPRYPLVIGEVDLDNFGVIKETVIEMDTRQPQDESEDIQLSNFQIYESNETDEIVVSLRRRKGVVSASRDSWYHIKLN